MLTFHDETCGACHNTRRALKLKPQDPIDWVFLLRNRRGFYPLSPQDYCVTLSSGSKTTDHKKQALRSTRNKLRIKRQHSCCGQYARVAPLRIAANSKKWPGYCATTLERSELDSAVVFLSNLDSLGVEGAVYRPCGYSPFTTTTNKKTRVL